MDTRFLQTLLAVIDHGSVAEAARRLNLTPSAVVQRIRALEDDIGQPLVQRAGQTMQATPAGTAILPEARRLLAVEADLKAAATAGQDVGLLRIGVINSVLTGLLPDVMVSLERSHPGMELYILPGMSSDLHDRVADGSLDAAILIEPPFVLPKTLRWTPLRREALLLITPLSVQEDSPAAILRQAPFIRYDRNHWGGRLVEQYLRRQRLHPQERHELDSLEAITVLVSRGLGVSLIPDWLPPWPEGTDLRRIALPEAPARTIGLLTPVASTRQRLIGAFCAAALRLCDHKGKSGEMNAPSGGEATVSVR